MLCGWLACNAVTCMQPHALLTLLLRALHVCTQIRKLAELMIELYSNLTGKPKGTTRTVDGAEYYGKGYEDSDLRIPSMRLVKQQLDWEPKTTLKEAMEMTMKVCIVGASHSLSPPLILFSPCAFIYTSPSIAFCLAILTHPRTSHACAASYPPPHLQVFIEKYADKLMAKRSAETCSAPAAKAAKM